MSPDHGWAMRRAVPVTSSGGGHAASAFGSVGNGSQPAMPTIRPGIRALVPLGEPWVNLPREDRGLYTTHATQLNHADLRRRLPPSRGAKWRGRDAPVMPGSSTVSTVLESLAQTLLGASREPSRSATAQPGAKTRELLEALQRFMRTR